MKHEEKNAVDELPVEQQKRRQWLGQGAATAAVALFGAVAAACSDDSNGGSADTDAGTGKDAGGGTGTDAGKDAGPAADTGTPEVDADVALLNALLSAEYTAITAYTAGAGLINSAPSTDPLYALAAVIVKIAVDIQSQHKLHAAALVEAIDGLSGTPVTEAEIAAKFVPPAALVANPTITNVLKFAAGAERGAAVSYNTVLASMEDAALRFLASSIEGDESQHFIVLAALVLGLAAPGPNLSEATAGDVVPEAFVFTVGDEKGLDAAPAPYFS